MPGQAKRVHEVIDLTEDETRETRPNKRPAYHHPASQSSSQNFNSSQAISVVEPDVLDLTQDDEGPVRELYGTFGLF